jgi:hypothetical protein
MSLKRATDVEIARLATRQSGVVSRKQLLALGLSDDQIRYRTAANRLRPVHRGVYAVGHDALPPRGRLVAALLVAGLNAALSHGTAAALWKLTRSMPPFIEITTTTRAPRPRDGLRFYTTTAHDVRTRDGLRITTPLRTLKDLAATRARS